MEVRSCVARRFHMAGEAELVEDVAVRFAGVGIVGKLAGEGGESLLVGAEPLGQEPVGI